MVLRDVPRLVRVPKQLKFDLRVKRLDSKLSNPFRGPVTANYVLKADPISS
jgi:hypothetical protein